MARELDRILDGSGPRRSAIVRAATELRLSTRQVYNLLARYRIDRAVTSLLPGGDRTRKKFLLNGHVMILLSIIMASRTKFLTGPREVIATLSRPQTLAHSIVTTDPSRTSNR